MVEQGAAEFEGGGEGFEGGGDFLEFGDDFEAALDVVGRDAGGEGAGMGAGEVTEKHGDGGIDHGEGRVA